uniref:Ig-like domain-containing protein n=1 Tax=Astyanax mexicanus TaxID=7994 RepID=A0A3B1K4Z1_ASTMX
MHYGLCSFYLLPGNFQQYSISETHLFFCSSGVHVLQWRHGCEGEQSSDGSLTVLNSINEFGYDGEDLIQFNCTSKTWITPEEKKNREREEKKNREREEKKNREREEEKNREREEKWSKLFDAVKKCLQCLEMLKMYLKYNTTDITPKHTPPAVFIFAKKSVRDSSDLTLTCLITGFYPKDVKMSLRKSGTSLPDHLITSSGIRPNHNGTYQLRKSVEIQEDDSGDYSCYVSHSSLPEPEIKRWVGRCTDCPDNAYQSLIIGVVVLGVLAAIYFLILGVLMMIIKRFGKLPLWNFGVSVGRGTDSIYLGLIIGVLVSGVLAVLFFLILCILMIILKIGSCTDCPKNSSLVLIVGVVVSGLVALLWPVIFYVLIRRMKLDNKEPLPHCKGAKSAGVSSLNYSGDAEASTGKSGEY